MESEETPTVPETQSGAPEETPVVRKKGGNTGAPAKVEVFRETLQSNDSKVIKTQLAKFKALFPSKIWKSYQNLFNAAIREPVVLPGDVALKVPSTTQKFWADTSTPVLGTRGALVIAPTGTGKSEMIGLITESRLYWGRTKNPPWKYPEDPITTYEIPHQVFIVTRTSLKQDLQAKIMSAMETRSITELQKNITKYGGPLATSKIPFSPEINILSYKEFSNMLEAANKNGRRWWAGLPLKNKNSDTFEKEFFRPLEMNLVEHRNMLSKMAYNKLDKQWGKFIALESIIFDETKCTLQYVYAEPTRTILADELKSFKLFLSSFLKRKQHTAKLTPSKFVSDGGTKIEIVIDYIKNQESISKTLLQEAFDRNEVWIRGMAVQENVKGLVGPFMFEVTYNFTDKTEADVRKFVEKIRTKLQTDKDRLADIGEVLKRTSPAFVIESDDMVPPKKVKGTLKKGILVITFGTEAVNSYFAAAYIDKKMYEQFKETDPNQPWPLSLEEFANNKGFEMESNSFEKEQNTFIAVKSPRFGHQYSVAFVNDKQPQISISNLDEGFTENFHPLDNCTVIFDEAHMLLDKQSLKSAEIPSTSLLFQAIADADCTTYFFSATIPFFAGLAFLEALQPSMYLNARLGNDAYTRPSTPYYEKHPELIDYRKLTTTSMSDIMKKMFSVKKNAAGGIKFDEARLGSVLKGRSFSCVSWSPSVEMQREYFARIDSSEYPIEVYFTPEHEEYLKTILKTQIKSLIRNPYKLLNSYNFFNVSNPDGRSVVPSYLRPSSSDFEDNIDEVKKFLFTGACPAIPSVLKKMRQVDIVNQYAKLLGRTVLISHAKDDRYGAELIAAALRAVGYTWKRVTINELGEDQHKARKRALRMGETIDSSLLLVKFSDEDHPIHQNDEYGPTPKRIEKSQFIVYSTTIAGGPDGYKKVTIESLTERVRKSGYHTYYQGNPFLVSVDNKLLQRRNNDKDEYWRAKRQLIDDIDGKVIYFWPGRDNKINASSFKRVNRINDLFKDEEEDWFFFISAKPTAESSYKKLEFPWLNDFADSERFDQMRKFFSVDKLTGKIKDDMIRLYTSVTNTPQTKTNEIGVVVVGGEFLSGIDIFSATTVIKMDAPPTRELAIQGTGRANRRGGMSAFEWEQWIIHEYGVKWQWEMPSLSYRNLNERVLMIEDDEDDVEENDEDEAAIDRANRIIRKLEAELEGQRRTSLLTKQLFTKLEKARAKLADLTANNATDRILVGYRLAVLSILDSQTNIKSAQPIDETTLNGRTLTPHEILRKLVFKDELVEVYNQFGQDKFAEWAVDYGTYTQPQTLNPKNEPTIDSTYIEKCVPTGFYLSWRHAINEPVLDETNTTTLDVLLTKQETLKKVIENLKENTDYVPIVIKKQTELEEINNKIKELNNLGDVIPKWNRAKLDFKEKNEERFSFVGGNVFSEIVRNTSDDRLFAIVKNDTLDRLELDNRVLFGQHVPATLQWLVEKGIAVWRIHLPISSIDKLSAEDETMPLKPTQKKPSLPKALKRPPGAKAKPSKRQKNANPNVKFRLEPYQIYGKDDSLGKKTPFSKGYPYKHAFNAFFDLRTMDKEHVAIQKSLIERAKKLGIDMGLFDTAMTDGFTWNQLYEFFFERTDDVSKTQANSKQLRTAFGSLLIDGMLDWNTAGPFFYGVSKTLEKAIGTKPNIATCAILTGLLYRNALVGDIKTILSRVFKPEALTKEKLPTIQKLLHLTALHSIIDNTPVDNTVPLLEMIDYIQRVLLLDLLKTETNAKNPGNRLNMLDLLIRLEPFTIEQLHMVLLNPKSIKMTPLTFVFKHGVKIVNASEFLEKLQSTPIENRKLTAIQYAYPKKVDFMNKLGIDLATFAENDGSIKNTLNKTGSSIIESIIKLAADNGIVREDILARLKNVKSYTKFTVEKFKSTIEEPWQILSTIPENVYEYQPKTEKLRRVRDSSVIDVGTFINEYYGGSLSSIEDETFLASKTGGRVVNELESKFGIDPPKPEAAQPLKPVVHAMLTYGTFNDIDRIVNLLKRSSIPLTANYFDRKHTLLILDKTVRRLVGDIVYTLQSDFTIESKTSPYNIKNLVSDAPEYQRYIKEKMKILTGHSDIVQDALNNPELSGRELWIEIGTGIKKKMDAILLADFPEETSAPILIEANPLCTICLESNCDCD